MSVLVNEFCEALAIEIEEQKKKGTARWEVRHGKLMEVRGPLYVYSFVLEDPTLAGPFDDTPVRVRAANSDSSGHIVGISGTQIYVAIEANLGEYVPSAQILAQPYYLLECLSERLPTLQSALCVMPNKCLRHEPFRYSEDLTFVPSPHIQSHLDSLNVEQKIAIRRALGSEVCYIWGPPGTGKTTVVGVTIASMIQCGRTVLLTANTNVAVDQALKATLEPKEGSKLLKSTEHYREGRILRLGTPQVEEVSCDDNLNLDKIVERKSEPLREQLLKIRDDLAESESRLAKLETLKISLERWQEIQALVAQTRVLRGEIEDSLNVMSRRMSILTESLKKEQERYERAKVMSAIMRFIRGMTLTKIENSLSSLVAEYDALSDKRVQAQAMLKETTGNLDSLGKEAKQIEKEFKQASASPEALSSEIASMQTRVDGLRTQIADLEKQIEEVRQEVIDQAVLIATTLARTYTMTEVYGRRFDNLVCDEASMASIPAVFWACSLAAKSVTVAGDFHQLAPIAISRDNRVKKWLREDVYRAAGVDEEELKLVTPDSPMVMLKKQYRMQPQIRAIVSSVFYHDQLRDGIPEEPSIQTNQPCPGVYAGIYDTSTIDPWCSWTRGYSRFNLYHAVLAVRLCLIAIHDFNDIGVITPYRAQTRLIKVLVDMEPTLKGKVIVSNVHRFQGSERDLIIFDLVDSTPLRVGKLLRGRIDSKDVDDSEGARLVNVAFSRAKKKLAIIANCSFLKARLKEDWSLQKILFSKSSPLGVFAAEQLVPGYSDLAIHQAREMLWYPKTAKVAPSSLWSEDEFHSGFQRDLEGARKYAIVMSPFITRERLQTYVELFRAKLEEGIELRVVTRPPYQQGISKKNDIEELLKHLKQIGIKVDQRPSMHQKVIIIDGLVVWFGSLNPLSHKNTQELMFRLEYADFTRQVMDECGLSAPGEETAELPPAVDIEKIPPRLCINCGQPMKVICGRFGPFYKCCGRIANVKREDLKDAIVSEARVCPQCGREMEIRGSKRGLFLGCSGYRDSANQCKYTRRLC